MNDFELNKKVNKTIGQLLFQKKYVAPVELLMELGYLSIKDHENWRMGNIAFMERACGLNLKKLSKIMKLLRVYAVEHNLKPSYTAYMTWGKQKKRKLKFSKSGKPFIEESYSTHYVIQYLKPKKREEVK
jgi:hypothetical protein